MLKIFLRPQLAAIFLVLLYLSSCNKQEHGVGVGLYSNDNDLGAHFVDTFEINTYSKVLDSNFSSLSGTVNLGIYHDPFFGKTRAGFYTQFEIGNSGVNFGDTLNCDSIVLYLKLGSNDKLFYGPDNNPLRIDVHQISQSAVFSSDSSYYTSSRLKTMRESLLDPNFNNLILPSFTDTVYLSRDSGFVVLQIPGVIALKLDREFGQRILDQNGTSVTESNENWLEEYKGLYVSVEDEAGGDILYIDMADFGTAMMIYYKEGADQEDEEYKFIIDEYSAHFNAYDHDYEGTGSLQMKSVLLDSTLGNVTYFAQAGGGMKGYIEIPNLLDLRETQLFTPVNKAELIIPVLPGSTKEYEPPSQFFLFYVNDEGKELLVTDKLSSSGYVIGQYDSELNQYVFNIRSYIQAVLDGDINTNQLVIVPSNGGSSPNRVLLNGADVDTTLGYKPIRFNLYYSSLLN